jgi:trafficking protein particle complex subunit 2
MCPSSQSTFQKQSPVLNQLSQKNPLHVSIFPSHDPTTNTLTPVRTPQQLEALLFSTLDVFDLRTKHNAVAGMGLSGDFGLLHAVDERLAAYGFETNTGVKFVCVVDMRGRRVDASVVLGSKGAGSVAAAAAASAAVGLRDGELKTVFKAMQNAYVRLLQNPFYEPDVHSLPAGRGGKKITEKRFAADMRRIGETWTPGVSNL